MKNQTPLPSPKFNLQLLFTRPPCGSLCLMSLPLPPSTPPSLPPHLKVIASNMPAQVIALQDQLQELPVAASLKFKVNSLM